VKFPHATQAGRPAFRLVAALSAAGILLGTGALSAFAQTGADAANDVPVMLPAYQVNSERVAGLEETMGREELRQPEPNLGRELMDIPGVYGHSRAADAIEPNIRGLGFDRVTTTLNGIPLFNGSPERTYSPVVLLGPVAVDSLKVIKALPSVTLGPATSGGRIELSTAPAEPTGTASAAPGGFVGLVYNGARDGVTAQGLFSGRAGPWSGRVTFFRNDLGDYSAPNGKVVAARLDDYGESIGAGWRGAGHDFRVEYLHRRLRLDETVSLPLDGKDSDASEVVASDRWKIDRGALERIEWRAGYAYTDPYITSEDRAVPALIVAHSTTRSAAGGVTSVWRTGVDSTLTAGGDFSSQERRAIRTTAAGKDYIWPDAIYQDAGLFAEWRRPLDSAWSLRIGGRGDHVWSDARDADQLALGRTIRQQYVTYNGPAAAQVKREDWVGSANLLLNWAGGQGVSAFLGSGLSAQPAPVTERYRAFLNALGGDGHGGNAVELGNPALSAEKKWEMVAGATWDRGWVALNANLYYYLIRDFILREPIGYTVPPVPHMVVFGYRNVDAGFRGGEVGVTLRPGANFTVPVTFAVSQGREVDTGVGLSEIPPWEATAALRYQQASARLPLWAQLGARVVGEKTNPAPLESPLYGHAGGFALFNFRTGALVSKHLRVEAGVENIFNHLYTEYLTPPVSPFKPASGNLLPGERVPGPGRWVWASVTWQY
jgi:iron complex outermembrane receptor protein